MQVPWVLNQQSYRDMMGYHGDATKDKDVVVDENEVYPGHCLFSIGIMTMNQRISLFSHTFQTN